MRTWIVLSLSALLITLAGCRRVAQAKNQAELANDLNTVRQVHMFLLGYSSDNEGKLPPDLQTLVDEQGMDLSLLEVSDGDGNSVKLQYVAGHTVADNVRTIILHGPPRPDAKRVVCYLDGSAKALPEAEFPAQRQADTDE
jgi:hypothetical protein